MLCLLSRVEMRTKQAKAKSVRSLKSMCREWYWAVLLLLISAVFFTSQPTVQPPPHRKGVVHYCRIAA